MNKPPVADKSPAVKEVPVVNKLPAMTESPVVQVSELTTHYSSDISEDQAGKTRDQTQQRSPGLLASDSKKAAPDADPDISLDAVLHGKTMSLSSTSGSSPQLPMPLADPTRQHLENGNGSVHGGEDVVVPDSSITATTGQISRQPPKQRGIMRMSSTSSSILGLRSLSTETSATTIVGRMATSTNIKALRALPLEERLNKARSCLKEL